MATNNLDQIISSINNGNSFYDRLTNVMSLYGISHYDICEIREVNTCKKEDVDNPDYDPVGKVQYYQAYFSFKLGFKQIRPKTILPYIKIFLDLVGDKYHSISQCKDLQDYLLKETFPKLNENVILNFVDYDLFQDSVRLAILSFNNHSDINKHRISGDNSEIIKVLLDINNIRYEFGSPERDFILIKTDDLMNMKIQALDIFHKMFINDFDISDCFFIVKNWNVLSSLLCSEEHCILISYLAKETRIDLKNAEDRIAGESTIGSDILINNARKYSAINHLEYYDPTKSKYSKDTLWNELKKSLVYVDHFYIFNISAYIKILIGLTKPVADFLYAYLCFEADFDENDEGLTIHYC